MSDLAGVGIAVALLALNFFFVGAEFALISARRTKIEPRAQEGSRAARTTLRAMENVSLMMAGCQLGITVCTLGLGAIGEPAVAHLLSPVFELLTVPEVLVYPISFAVALIIVVTLHVVVGEMVPKNLVLAAPERSALLLGPPLSVLVTVLKPLIWVLNAIANGCLRLLRVEPRDEVNSTFTKEEMAGVIDESRREGMIEADSYDLVSGALTFTGRTVESVLLTVDELRVVHEDSTVAAIEELCAETGFSRFPVARGADGQTPVEMIGYLHIKDVLDGDDDKRHQPFEAKWIRPMANLRSSSRSLDALRTMQLRGGHLARVVDDEGVLLGLVALEDVLEELVGEVRDAAPPPN